VSSYTLVVCEKPDAARRIASALGNAKENRSSSPPFSRAAKGGISVFDVTYAGRNYKVCSASGHLYGISDRTKNRSVYPVLDLEWAPIDEKGKSARVARFINTISAISQSADSFIHACDYDQEGEVIGYSILEYACGGKYDKALRAKFSTLTDEEIREAFATLAKPSSKLAAAGRSRHMLDFIYGVNLSRALAQSFKAGNENKGYRNLSIGRVQGPTLAFVADREREIRLHVPDPYWIVTADFENKDARKVHAHYEKPRIEKLVDAQAVLDACIGRDGVVSKVSARKVVLRPPTPFSTGDLQREAHRLFRLAPGYTLAIAEKLYLRALISYPRTSSQKLPPSINYAKILSGLSRVSLYSQPASMLLSRGRLVPNEGPMSDPAHPAIYPTGVAPQLSGLEFKVYDLIAKRFLATFGDPAVVQRQEVSINVNGHVFHAEGKATLYDGWMTLYKPYMDLEQSALPKLSEGDVLANKQITMEEKFTQPPWRYNQASLLAKMEEQRIGTKATRAETIATLFKRNYIIATKKKKGSSVVRSNNDNNSISPSGGIEATDLGFAVVESMREHAPTIVSTELTRSMEDQLEGVEQGVKEPADVIEYAVEKLIESLAAFRDQSATIGKQIGTALATAQPNVIAIGRCPVCKNGQLRIIRSRATKKRFVGCSNYSSGCRASAPLPQKGSIKVSKSCQCGWPIISVSFGRGKRWNTCVNMQCPYTRKKEGREG
jgi:DNA topoisomerase-1